MRVRGPSRGTAIDTTSVDPRRWRRKSDHVRQQFGGRGSLQSHVETMLWGHSDYGKHKLLPGAADSRVPFVTALGLVFPRSTATGCNWPALAPSLRLSSASSPLRAGEEMRQTTARRFLSRRQLPLLAEAEALTALPPHHRRQSRRRPSTPANSRARDSAGELDAELTGQQSRPRRSELSFPVPASCSERSSNQVHLCLLLALSAHLRKTHGAAAPAAAAAHSCDPVRAC